MTCPSGRYEPENEMSDGLMSRHEYQRREGARMLERLLLAGFDRWDLSGSQLFRRSDEREQVLHVPMLGSHRVEWCLYADAFAASHGRPAGFRVRVCYRLEGMSGYQHVNCPIPLPLDCYPGDLDAIVSHLVRTARDVLADGLRLGCLVA